MPVAIRTATRLQDQDDVNVTPAAGVDGYALTYDHDTTKFVLAEMVAGGASITDITYADLVTAIGASTLTPGGWYRITDFATVHYIIDSDGTRHVATAQVDTITLTGTGGTAAVTGAGDLTKTATWTTDLPGTAAAFVTSHDVAYAAEGIVVTSSGADIIFTSDTAGTGFTHPVIANTSDDLAGIVVNTTLNDYGLITGTTEPLLVFAVAANQIHGEAKSDTYPQDILYYDWNPANWLTDDSFIDGSSNIIAGFKGVITFRHDTQYDNYAPYDWRHCKTRRWKTVTAAWDEEAAYTAGDFVNYNSYIYRTVAAITGLTAQVDTITLTGTGGTAAVTVAGGLTKTATWTTDLPGTAAAFVTSHATAYADEGIVVTSDGADIIFTSDTAGVAFDSPVITNTSDDLAGTVVNTTLNHSANENPSDDALGRWAQLLPLEATEYWNASSASTNGIPSDPDAWADFTLFASGQPSGIHFEAPGNMALPGD